MYRLRMKKGKKKLWATLNDKPTRVVIKYHYKYMTKMTQHVTKLSELTANPTPVTGSVKLLNQDMCCTDFEVKVFGGGRYS